MTAQCAFSLFLENNQNGNSREAAYLYKNPLRIISITDPHKLDDGFMQIQSAMEDGFHLAGWISYEAGLWFEDKLKSLIPEKLEYPLIYMGVYHNREILSSTECDYYWQEYDGASSYELQNIRLSLNHSKYETAFNQIKEYLKSGDIYQVNFTQKASFEFTGSGKSLYAALRKAQRVEYGAYIEGDDLQILSLSPELFIKKNKNELTTKPMKGTCKRGRTNAEDNEYSNALYNSDKEKAENLMIVDLLRNDLSKLAEKSSLDVKELFEIEKYRTLFTMTSTITAKLKTDKSAVDVMKAIFPCGSVTGAPKIRAQQIISELEQHQRGIYTGAIGYFTPSGDMCFNVPIRTITLKGSGQPDEPMKGELGIGGAIVADSTFKSEYEECLLKAQFVTKKYTNFDLIESIYWSQSNGYRFIDEHLDRMQKSADYFDFHFDKKTIISELDGHSKYLGNGNYKVRLLLSRNGTTSISSFKVKMIEKEPLVVLANEVIDSNNPMFFHKTTDRAFYRDQLSKYKKHTNCFDVIFVNEYGELTEGSFSNLFLEKDGIFYTPPVECGLLAGVFRQFVLDDKDVNTVEKKLFAKDLKNADQLYLCNSIKGLIPVKFQDIQTQEK